MDTGSEILNNTEAGMMREDGLECDNNFSGNMAPLEGSENVTEAKLDWTRLKQ